MHKQPKTMHIGLPEPTQHAKQFRFKFQSITVQNFLDKSGINTVMCKCFSGTYGSQPTRLVFSLYMLCVFMNIATKAVGNLSKATQTQNQYNEEKEKNNTDTNTKNHENIIGDSPKKAHVVTNFPTKVWKYCFGVVCFLFLLVLCFWYCFFS